MKAVPTKAVPMNRFVLPDESILRAREKLVLDHFQDEVDQDWGATLSTFPHPHYELIAQMKVHDGEAAVREYYDETRVAFPDQHHEIIAFRHSVDAVIVEFWLLGTHRGPLGEIPATGGTHRTRMNAYFVFDENENLVTERIYFDQLTILKQLVEGVDRRKPSGILKLLRILKGVLAMSGGAPDARLLDTTPPDFVRRD
ncbi:ester cyclase [Streptomyces sp. NPDC088725]|uniref:ester cyclase n=1 Tax=Streptomyces sp. NPDC088725 TaxID=3365873 RepID=UPI00381F64D5